VVRLSDLPPSAELRQDFNNQMIDIWRIKMKVKILVFSLLLLFAIGCAGTPTGGSSSAGSNSSSKGLSKEKLKSMGVDENKGYY
jgi:hypothetical protein